MRNFFLSRRMHSALGLALLMTLYACSTVTEREVSSEHQRIAEQRSKAGQQLHANAAPPPSVVEEKMPRFARRSIPLDRSRVLPAGVGMVTLQLPGRYNLKTVAEHIERTTRIPVTIAPDAMVPMTDFAPTAIAPRLTRQSSTSGSGGTNLTSPAQQAIQTAANLVEQAGGPRQLAISSNAEDLYELNHKGTLASLLNAIAVQGQLQWMYERGQIRFYRLVTRNLTVRSLPSSVTQTGSLTLSAGQGGSMSVANTSQANFWQSIEKGVKDLISTSGKVMIDAALGSVLITDSFHNVASVERYIEGINQQLSRQVAISVEVFQVSLNAASQAGIDWAYVTSSARLGTINAVPAPSLVSNTGSIGFVRSASSGVDNSFIIQLLERFGKVSSAYSSVVTTMNRQPVPLGSVTTQSYLKQVTPTVLTTAGGGTAYGAPALTPGEVTTGFIMSLLPVVLDSNQIMLQCSISISSLKELVTFSTGSGNTQQSVQQPTVSSFDTQQRMTVRSGDTIVLSGFESESVESRQNDLVREILPGSKTNTRQKSTLVVMITPRLTDH